MVHKKESSEEDVDVSVGRMEKAQAKRDNAKPVGGPTLQCWLLSIIKLSWRSSSSFSSRRVLAAVLSLSVSG